MIFMSMPKQAHDASLVESRRFQKEHSKDVDPKARIKDTKRNGQMGKFGKEERKEAPELLKNRSQISQHPLSSQHMNSPTSQQGPRKYHEGEERGTKRTNLVLFIPPCCHPRHPPHPRLQLDNSS
jgi:hypothetical protein